MLAVLVAQHKVTSTAIFFTDSHLLANMFIKFYLVVSPSFSLAVITLLTLLSSLGVVDTFMSVWTHQRPGLHQLIAALDIKLVTSLHEHASPHPLSLTHICYVFIILVLRYALY